EFGMARGPGPGRPGGRERLLTEMDQTLSLTPDQHQRVLADLDRARHAQVAVRESVHVWIERELNPDQRERWKEMEERFAGAGHGGPGMGARTRMGPGEAGRGDLRAKLNLTADQKDKLAEVRERQARRAIPIRADLELAALDLHKLMRADRPDQRQLDAQVD